MKIIGDFERFHYFNFETSFQKSENFLKKKKLGYRFLVESTTIENPIFPYKTALSKATVELNGAGIEMGLSQRTVPQTFICLKI